MIVKGSIHIGNFIYTRSVSNTEDTVGDIRLYATGGEYIVEKCTAAASEKGGGVWEATGQVHERLHKITSQEDHDTEIDNAEKLAGWDEDGKPAAHETKQLSSKELKSKELKSKELKLPHVISSTAPDRELFDEGTYWYRPPHTIFVLYVENTDRAWLEISNLKLS